MPRTGTIFRRGNPCGKIRLQELACETFAGFIWVNMDPDCISLKEFLGPIWDEWNAREIHTWKTHHGQHHVAALQLEGGAGQLQ